VKGKKTLLVQYSDGTADERVCCVKREAQQFIDDCGMQHGDSRMTVSDNKGQAVRPAELPQDRHRWPIKLTFTPKQGVAAAPTAAAGQPPHRDRSRSPKPVTKVFIADAQRALQNAFGQASIGSSARALGTQSSAQQAAKASGPLTLPRAKASVDHHERQEQQPALRAPSPPAQGAQAASGSAANNGLSSVAFIVPGAAVAKAKGAAVPKTLGARAGAKNAGKGSRQ